MPATAAGQGMGIGGDPAAIEAAAAEAARAATAIDAAGAAVSGHGDTVVANWAGSASNAAHERIRFLGDRTAIGADVVGDLPAILTSYAGALRTAQARFAAGHAGALAAASAASAAATAQAGLDAEGTLGVDPGHGGRQAAVTAAASAAAEDGAAAQHAMAGAMVDEKVANEVAAAAVEALSGRMVAMRADMAAHGPSPAAADRADEARADALAAAAGPGGQWYFDRVNAGARLTPEQQRDFEKGLEESAAREREEWAGIKDGARPFADAWDDLTEDPAGFAQQWWGDKMALYDDLDEDFNGTALQMGKDAIFWDERQAGNVDYANGAMLPGLAARVLLRRVDIPSGHRRRDHGAPAAQAPTLPRRNLTSGTKGHFSEELNNPEANTRYVVDGNKEFVTDDLKRTIEIDAELVYRPNTGDVFRDHDAQTSSGGADRRGPEHPTPDDGAHWIGTSLGGNGEAINIAPGDQKINRGMKDQLTYRSLEATWTRELKAGNEVRVHIVPEYPGDSQRPTRAVVNWTLNGAPQSKTVVVNERPA